MSDIKKGGQGSGIKGHFSEHPDVKNHRTNGHVTAFEYQGKEINISKHPNGGWTGNNGVRHSTEQKAAESSMKRHSDEQHKKHVDTIVAAHSQANDHNSAYDPEHHRKELMNKDPKKVKEQHDELQEYLNFKPKDKPMKKSDPLHPEPIYKAQEKPYEGDLNDLVEKGGKGSGVKGHTTEHGGVQVSHEKYSWGSMRSAKTGKDGIDGGAMIHPEHFEEMKQVHSRQKPEGQFKDEQGRHWHVKPNDKGGVSLQDKHGGQKIHLDDKHMQHLNQDPDEAYHQEYHKILGRLGESHGLPITSSNHLHIRERAVSELKDLNRKHGKPDKYEPGK